MQKPAFAFQWHITDECDQRCKHCYIFANGACAGFKRMPWEQMVQVVDQAQALCERIGRRPYFYVTGGDPILGTSDVFPDHAPALRRMAPLLAILPNGLPS